MDLFTRALWGLPLQSGGRRGQRCQSPAAMPGSGRGRRGLPPGFPARPVEPVPGEGEERRAGLLGGSPRTPVERWVLLTDSVSL